MAGTSSEYSDNANAFHELPQLFYLVLIDVDICMIACSSAMSPSVCDMIVPLFCFHG